MQNPNIDRIKDKIDDVKLIMSHNIDNLLERQERLELLQNKSNSLQEYCSKYQKTAQYMKHHFMIENLKKKWVLFSILTVIILFILLVIIMRRKS